MARTSRTSTSGKTRKRQRAERGDAAAAERAAVASSPVSFDDAAMRLMQVDAADVESLSRACEAFEQLAGGAALSATVREMLATAARALRNAAEHPERLDAAVAEASRVLETAMRGSAHDAPPRDDAPSRRDQYLPADADRALLRDFVAEGLEYVEEAQAALLVLESEPDNADAINTVFRAFHTIKGTSAFLGLDRISALAHHAESLLDRVRKGTAPFTGRYPDLALRSVDLLRASLDAVASALDGEPLLVPEGYDALLQALATPEVARGTAPGTIHEPAERVRIELQNAGASRPRLPDHGTTSSVRIRTDRLDRLIDLVGELVIAQSMLAQDLGVLDGGSHVQSRTVTHAGKLTRELHDLSMSMRMVPLKGTFLKLARQVRDLAQKTGKQVELVIEGAETEIDRHMVDAIADPLMHMVRNAVDHGIESPDEREAHGKSRTGVVRVSASHAGGTVVVELTDDGQGLDRDRIMRKAVGLGLIAPDHALTDGEAFELIFAPGFSTAQKVSEVSGRGVGLDVVRRNIEALRGRIDIESEPGKGTRFLMRLPLTLAITDGMLVRVGAERYIVPTAHIQMSFRPERSMLSTVVGRGELVMLRGELLPIVRLHRLFGVDGAVTDPTAALLMIVGDSQRRTALLVDELLGQQQVVAKPLGSGIERIPGISGGAILGDGRVGLILDVAAVVTIARQTPTTEHASAPHASRSVA